MAFAIFIKTITRYFAHSSTITTARAIYSSDPLLVIRVESLSSQNLRKKQPRHHITAHQIFCFILLSPILLFLLLLLAVRSRSPPPSLCPSSPCSLPSLPPSSYPSHHNHPVLPAPAIFLALSFDHLAPPPLLK